MPEWINLLIPCVFFVIWIASQMMSQRQPRPAPRRAGPPEPIRQQDPTQAELADEIERFLKRAQQREAQFDDDVEILEPEIVGETPTRRLVQGPVDTSMVQPHADLPPARDPYQALGSPEKELGAPIGSDRERRQQRSQRKNKKTSDASRQLGQLADSAFSTGIGVPRSTTAAIVPGGPAASQPDFAAMLRSPDNIRQAIVMSEILQRPEHRWA